MNFENIMKFVKSISAVANSCGYEKAIRRATFIIIQKLFVNNKERCILTKSGHKMYLIPNDVGISTELRTFQTHEPLTTKILTNFIEDGWTIMDIGSNIGYYTLLESTFVKEQGNVIAIEPVPQNFAYLVKNVNVNRANNVKCLNLAISNEEGKIKMIQSPYSNWCKIITEETLKTSKNEKTDIINVPTTTIDNLVKRLELKRVDLLRMDIEGYEEHAIRGAKSTINKYHPKILMEIHTKILGKKGTVKLLEYLKNEGYKIKWSIIRDLDFSGVGNEKDIKQKSFEEISNYTENDIELYLST